MARTCASISHTARLRTPPPGRSRPVAQKSHARAQPNCELIHKVYFAVGSATNPAASPRWRRSLRSRASSGSGSGMRTDSIKPPSGRRNRYFTKPSAARLRSTISNSGKITCAAKARRIEAESQSIPPTLATPSRCTAAKTRAALAASTPWPPRAAPRAGRSSSRRLSGTCRHRTPGVRSRACNKSSGGASFSTT